MLWFILFIFLFYKCFVSKISTIIRFSDPKKSYRWVPINKSYRTQKQLPLEIEILLPANLWKILKSHLRRSILVTINRWRFQTSQQHIMNVPSVKETSSVGSWSTHVSSSVGICCAHGFLGQRWILPIIYNWCFIWEAEFQILKITFFSINEDKVIKTDVIIM